MQKINESKPSLFQMDIGIGGIGLSQKAVLAKNLAVMQRSGLNIVESLGIIAESSQGKMKRIIKEIVSSVSAGNTLAQSLERFPKVFSGIFVSSVYAGETSGTLDENLENLSVQLEKENDLKNKIKGAMLYPIVVLIAAFILGLGMSFLVLPKIVPLFEGLKVELPITTRWLIAFSHFVGAHGVGLLIGIVVAVIFLSWFLRQKLVYPVTHWIFLHTPILKGISKHSNLARFSRTLGTLLKSGLSIDEALQVTEKSLGNYYYKKAIRTVVERVHKGSTMSENLKQYGNLFPKMVTRMIFVGEESGKLEETLLYLAGYYEVEVDNSTKSLSTAIEPILLLIIGGVVAFLALSIITPIYNITGNIRR